MITSAGTRNVVSAEAVIARVQEEERIPRERLELALNRLESDSKLVRRERRRDLYLYEITSEFLVPWISRRRQELVGLRKTRTQRRRRLLVGSFAGFFALVAVLGSLGFWALKQRNDAEAAEKNARQAETEASSLVLAFSSTAQLESRLDASLILGLAGYRLSDRPETRSSVISALEAAKSSPAMVILRGHDGSIRSVAVSGDDRML